MERVQLDEGLEAFVVEFVESGRFTSSDAVLREGLRLLEARERRRADLSAAIESGLADSRAERVRPMDEVFDRVEARLRGARAAE